jgi:hypothetical protein
VTALLQGIAEDGIGRFVVPLSFKIIASSVWNSEKKRKEYRPINDDIFGVLYVP